MVNCWANIFGSCSGGQSAEHVLSDCLFTGSVTVQGLPWCKDPFDIGPNGLTSNILCKHHNESLSILDATAKKSLETMFDAHRLIETRKRTNPDKRDWRYVTLGIDRVLFARWCLKTLINTANVQHKSKRLEWTPAPELVNTVFGNRPFSDGAGLGILASAGESFSLGRTYHVTPISSDARQAIEAVSIRFSGFRFIASWQRPLVDISGRIRTDLDSDLIDASTKSITVILPKHVRLRFA